MSKAIIHSNQPNDKALISYITGFVLSLVFTLIAYFLVVNHIISSKWGLAYLIIGIAVIQAIVQLFFFLHISADSRPRWKLITLTFMLLVVGILVIGSLWIMQNLNYRMMSSPEEMRKYMQSQGEGL